MALIFDNEQQMSSVGDPLGTSHHEVIKVVLNFVFSFHLFGNEDVEGLVFEERRWLDVLEVGGAKALNNERCWKTFFIFFGAFRLYVLF